MSLYLGRPPCYVFDYYRPFGFLSWCSNPKSVVDASGRIDGKGLLGVVALTGDLASLTFVSPVARPLNLGRRSVLFCFVLGLVSPNAKYLIDLAFLLTSSFGLNIGLCHVNDWGQTFVFLVQSCKVELDLCLLLSVTHSC